MALTFSELLEELYNVDEVTLLEVLGITSEELVNKFVDKVEEYQEDLRELIDDTKEGFDFYDYDDKQ
jgi:predicted CopG family antitoxin